MNNYRNEILNEFIDRYEKSSYYKGKSEKPRKISIVLHKKFPEYGHSFHYEETNELENIAFQLQSQGFVEFSKKSILGDRELILNQEENCLDRIYKELKRAPVKEKIIHYVKLLDQYHEEAFIKDFVDEIINSIKTNTTDDIYSYYRNIDILLIDDIQFLFGKEKSSEMFFHIFNEIINNNHQIVITSDKMPDELQGIEERLISRFKSGLSFGIDPPEFETAKAILEKKIENLGNTDLVITDDVLDFMVMNYCNDIRSLEGQLKRLFFCSIMESTNYIDMNFASEVFKDQKTIKKAQEPLTKEFILKTTAEFYYLTISQIISKNRTRNLVTPREICMYLMRELLDITFSEIGTTFSNRDHSTVMKACKRVETKIKKDPDYKLAVDKLKQKLGTM